MARGAKSSALILLATGDTTSLSASTRSHRPRHSGLRLCLRRSGVQERQEASHRASC